MSKSLEARIEALELRLAAQEDMTAILQLIAAYGPAVDRGDGAATAALWFDDGRYDYGAGALEGRAALEAIVETPSHLRYLEAGCAHVLSLPQVRLMGDRAEAVNVSRVYLKSGEGWQIERCSANHWRFERRGGEWRVLSRENRLLEGAAEARALLRL